MIALHRRIQQLADGLEHRVGKADVHFCLRPAQFERKAGGDDNFGRGRDVGELGIHLGADVLELELEHWRPCLAVFGEHHIEQVLDDALLGGREVAAFDPGVKAPIAAEHVVDHEKDQVGLEHHQARAPHRLCGDQVEIGRHHQVAHELGVFLHLDWSHRDLGVAVHVIEQADTEITRKALIDELHGGHAPTHDAFLSGEVVGAHPLGRCFFGRRLVGLPADAPEQGVHFFLGEKVRRHGGGLLLNDEGVEQGRLDRAT